MTSRNPADDLAQDALNRLCRAEKRGTGCHLTAEMVAALGITHIGQIWQQPDPRKHCEED